MPLLTSGLFALLVAAPKAMAEAEPAQTIECDPSCGPSSGCCSTDACPIEYPVSKKVDGSCCFLWLGDCHSCCKPPAGPEPPPGPSKDPRFLGSLLVTDPSWISKLNEYAKLPVEQKWELCYESFTQSKTSPAAFHESCDKHNKTLAVARNNVDNTPRVFGGFAATTWNQDACCATKYVVGGDERYNADCDPPGQPACIDYQGTLPGFPDPGGQPPADFLFKLWPGQPQRFGPRTDPASDSGANNYYQLVAGTNWPTWGTGSGSNDLAMGTNGALGQRGCCNQGETFEGSNNQICGGDAQATEGKWGKTDMEVWSPVK